MTLTLAKWTLDDYHQMVETGLLQNRRVELLNGEIVEMSPEGPEHASLNGDSKDYLGDLLKGKAIVREAKPITLPEQASEPEPDLAIVAPPRSQYRDRHPYPADIFWVVEYSQSSLKKDCETKRKNYAAAGIPGYWIVNLKKGLVLVLRDPKNGDYQVEKQFSTGLIYPLAFPELAVSVSYLLTGNLA